RAGSAAAPAVGAPASGVTDIPPVVPSANAFTARYPSWSGTRGPRARHRIYRLPARSRRARIGATHGHRRGSTGPSVGHRRLQMDRYRLSRIAAWPRSEEHTSELQSRENLVCRLLLEKKKKK